MVFDSSHVYTSVLFFFVPKIRGKSYNANVAHLQKCFVVNYKLRKVREDGRLYNRI